MPHRQSDTLNLQHPVVFASGVQNRQDGHNPKETNDVSSFKIFPSRLLIPLPPQKKSYVDFTYCYYTVKGTTRLQKDEIFITKP